MSNRSTFFLAVVLAGLPAVTTYADIAPDPIGGGKNLDRRSAKEPTKVAMDHETIRVYVARDKPPEFHVTFRMRNHGKKKEKLQVGFPANYSGELQDFRVSVDGRRISAADAVDTITYDGGGFERSSSTFWKVWRTEFEPDKDVILDVRYTANLERNEGFLRFNSHNGWSVSRFLSAAHSTIPREEYLDLVGKVGQTQYFRYILRTGARWHGPIGSCRLELHFGDGLTADNMDPGTGNLRSIKYHRENRKLLVWETTDLEPTFDVPFLITPDTTQQVLFKLQNSLYRRFPDHPEVALTTARFHELKGDLKVALDVEYGLFDAWRNRVSLFSKDTRLVRQTGQIWNRLSYRTWQLKLMNPKHSAVDRKHAKRLTPILVDMAHRLQNEAKIQDQNSLSAKGYLRDLETAIGWSKREAPR